MPRSPLPEPLGSAREGLPNGSSAVLRVRGTLGRRTMRLPALPGHHGERNVLGADEALVEARLSDG